MIRVLKGYRYWVCELTPGSEGWEQFRKIEYRCELEDAQKIVDVLYETDILFSVYFIMCEPVYKD